MNRFLNGFLFGAGFTLASLLVWALGLWVVFPALNNDRGSFAPDLEEVHAPPDIAVESRFLGSPAILSGDFALGSDRQLSAGPGRIVGTVTVDGKPRSGLQLRLALNGSVKSQWATTGEDGQYEVSVPYGNYRIYGYELDDRNAHSVLAGKIEHPGNNIRSGTFEVAAGVPGDGLNLEFVAPVVLDMSQKRFSADEDVVIRWQPYPGAEDYKIQIHGISNVGGYGDIEYPFRTSECPVVREAQINLSEYDVELKPGFYYIAHIEARDGDARPVSQNATGFSDFAFQMTR